MPGKRGREPVLNNLLLDFRIIFERDPAARNWLEVLFCYSGLQALLFHRLAHFLYKFHIPFIPRLLSHIARFFTGIEIHPGATIGKGVFIDHGMGVVIGETAIVGDYALIYQGVTLGGTGKESGKRHPTLGENVVVGAGAKVLGNITIGDNVRIGAGSVVLRDVPSDCTVVGVPGRIVYKSGVRIAPLEHGSLPDSEAQVIRALVDRIEALEQQLQDLQAIQTTNFANRSMVPPIFVTLPTPAAQPSPVESELQAELQTGQQIAVFTNEAIAPSSRSSCRISDRVIDEFLDGSGI